MCVKIHPIRLCKQFGAEIDFSCILKSFQKYVSAKLKEFFSARTTIFVYPHLLLTPPQFFFILLTLLAHRITVVGIKLKVLNLWFSRLWLTSMESASARVT